VTLSRMVARRRECIPLYVAGSSFRGAVLAESRHRYAGACQLCSVVASHRYSASRGRALLRVVGLALHCLRRADSAKLAHV
jgi:hypothetical protein